MISGRKVFAVGFDLELAARSQKLEAGFNHPFRNEKGLPN